MTTLLEKFYLFFFLPFIPVAILFDSQIIFPKEYFHQFLLDGSESFSLYFNDQLLQYPPEWFKALIGMELFLQLPYAIFAVYAFARGGRPWIRMPSIIYASHAITSVFTMLVHVLFHVYPKSEKFPGPVTFGERMKLASLCFYFLIGPVILLTHMLLEPNYGQTQKKLKGQ